MSEDSFLDAAEASLVGGEAEWFVSARLPSGTTLPVELVRELIDIRNADSHKPG